MNRSARLLAISAFLVLNAGARLHAQTAGSPPSFVDYQGFVLDSAGAPLAPDTGAGVPQPVNYTMEFRMYDAATGGALIWGEKQNVTVSGGKFSVQLGKGTAVSGTAPTFGPSAIASAFASPLRFLGVTVIIPPASTGTEVVPRLQFLTSPFAFIAEKSKTSENVAQTVGTASMSTASITNATIANATINAGTFTGSGAGLTALNATNVTSGKLGDGFLSTNVALLNKVQTFSAANTFTAANSFTADNSFSGITNYTNLVVMNNNDIRFRSSGDASHRLGFYGGTKSFTGMGDLNGVVLAGFNGGVLGTTDGGERTVLRWTSDRIGIPVPSFLEFGFGAAKGQDAEGGKIAYQKYSGGLDIVGAGPANATGTNGRTITLHSQGGVNSLGKIYISATDTTQIRFQNLVTNIGWDVGSEQNGHFIFISNVPNIAPFISRSTGALTQQSDVRLKKDIAPMTGVLDKVLKMRAVSYRFNAMTEDQPKSMGFIAQEVEPLFPEVVTENNGFKAMAYSELIPVAIAALQEEHVRTDALSLIKDTEIAKLKEQNAALERRLQALEEKFAK